MTKPRTRCVDRVRAGLASVVLVAVFAVLFPPAFVAGFEGLVQLFNPSDIGSSALLLLVVTSLLVVGFILGSGWALIRFSLVADRLSAVVASGCALVSLYAWMAVRYWPGSNWESYESARQFFVSEMIEASIAVVPVWLLYTGAVGFARSRLIRTQSTPTPAPSVSEQTGQKPS